MRFDSIMRGTSNGSRLLPHESPVAARLLPRDLAALEQRHPHASPGEVERRRTAVDTAANNDDVRTSLHATHVSPSARVRRARMSAQAASTSAGVGGLSATISWMRA
jgi:hypothetical protein